MLDALPPQALFSRLLVRIVKLVKLFDDPSFQRAPHAEGVLD
jgi:hypothetical protein